MMATWLSPGRGLLGLPFLPPIGREQKDAATTPRIGFTEGETISRRKRAEADSPPAGNFPSVNMEYYYPVVIDLYEIFLLSIFSFMCE